ncbi:serine hydrolase [Pseudoduganella sp. LjRoot289]|uniref:serine hydrolase domain-containing protein n=1 Tax=Pseudoduganella sp. LjRoot289 TaxID=3342314 RepID=UPI003ED02857
MRTMLGWALMGGGMMQAVAAGPAAPKRPAATAAASAVSLAASAATQLDRELAAVVNDVRHPLSGLSVVAIRDGKLTYQQQFGLRRIDTTGQGAAAPVTPATMFRIASISKMMTTLGVMMLVEQGRLGLDTDAGAYLGFPLRNPHYPDRVITLRHLLSHTSSLRDDAGYSWGTDTTLAEVLLSGGAKYGSGAMWAGPASPGNTPGAAGTPGMADAGSAADGQDTAPGAYFTYCNLNWGVIGTIMERVSGERFDRLMQRLLLAPMGLRGGYNTAAFLDAELADTATLYRKRTRDTAVWDPAGPWIAQVDDYGAAPPAAPAGIAGYVIGSNGTLFSPTGGLRISAPDLGKIMLMLINQGRHEGRQILKPETLRLMFSEQWTYRHNNGDTLRGLYHSWGLGTQRFANIQGQGNRLVRGGGFSAVGHHGEAYGLMSTFAVDLAGRNGLVSLIGGFGSDPEQDPGQYSALSRSEETILTALHRRAVLGRTDERTD